MGLSELLKARAALEGEIVLLKERIAFLDEEAEAIVAEQLATVRHAQAKEFGAVNAVVDGYKVTQTVPKKVKWDQPKLYDLFARIVTSGDDPAQYLRMELSVPEKMYDGFAPAVREMFDAARSVEQGKVTYKFEEVES